MKDKDIPVYSIDTFKPPLDRHTDYQVEVFKGNRQFKVTYPHRHDFYEMLFITKGSGIYTIDFQEYTIEPNKIFFVSPAQVHAIRYSDDVDGFIFLFTSEFYLFNKQDRNKLQELPFFNRLSGQMPPLLLENDESVSFLRNLFMQACTEQQNSDADSADVIGALLDIILVFCKRNYPVAAVEDKLLKGRQLLLNFYKLVEKNHRQNLTVKSYASMLHITPSHLNETVKKHTGKTATEIIDEKTVLEIKRMLVHTDLNVNEIAAEFNFTDQSYFSKFFKKNVGESPQSFRGQMK